MQFPVYRKYSNESSYFIIHSLTEWTEYKKFGKNIVEHHFVATQFPEKLLIQDLINLQEGVLTSCAEEIAQIKKV